MKPNAVEHIEMTFCNMRIIPVYFMWKIILVSISGRGEFEWFNKGLISLCQEPWQGGCLELHIAIQHYTEYPTRSVKTKFRWLLTGLFRVKDSSNNFGQISTVIYHRHTEINAICPSLYILFVKY